MKRHLYLTMAAIAATACAAGGARAQFVMDGTRDAAYGAPLSVQDTQTQFGDAGAGDPINGGGGSEIDAIYAKVSGGRLYVMITGNLEANFNKLEVFIDSEAGQGINTVDSADFIANAGQSAEEQWHNNNMLPGGVDSFCCGGFQAPDGGNTENDGALQRMHGLTFDADFNADHYITITHGFENALTPGLGFYASSAHYADLTDGAAGRSGALGMQLAQQGLPRVLRGTTADFDVDGDADGVDFLTWQRGFGKVNADNPNRLQGNADGDDNPDPSQTNLDVDGDDFNIWKAVYGFDIDQATFGADYFKPQDPTIDDSNVLLGPALPGLVQGDLIDKVYAFSANGGATDNAGTGAITRELEFVLPPIAGTNNAASHRNMENIIDLQMAIDNSNTAGVSGGAGAADQVAAEAVATGIEFSVPLSEIGASLTSGPIKIMAFVNGGGHHFASNQFTGNGVSQGNLGGDGFGNFKGVLIDQATGFAVNMVDYEGDQFVTVSNPATAAGSGVPEPTGALLLGTALVALARRRRA